MAVQLRVFDADLDDSLDALQDPTVRVRLADLLPLLAVTVTPDLYDVLRSFNTLQRTPA
ncbi:MAG: hypothetical protein HY289_01685 [Planctomycetes bacterium]|nr:hypothetical protein [Planctomycetota bacterium]